jgi:hypothetical protein
MFPEEQTSCSSEEQEEGWGWVERQVQSEEGQDGAQWRLKRARPVAAVWWSVSTAVISINFIVVRLSSVVA